MLKQLVPPNLLADENIKALVEAIEPEFEKVKSEIINVLIYPRIDQLSEEVLDLLAWQFHIEGYELATNITEKRNLIKKAIELHRYKGTKYAVLQVLKALNLDGQINEWFEYDGQPYHFKIILNYSPQKTFRAQQNKKLLKLIENYKNLRSKLEAVYIKADVESNIYSTSSGYLKPTFKNKITFSGNINLIVKAGAYTKPKLKNTIKFSANTKAKISVANFIKTKLTNNLRFSAFANTLNTAVFTFKPKLTN